MKYTLFCALTTILLITTGCDLLEDSSDGSSSGGTENITATSTISPEASTPTSDAAPEPSDAAPKTSDAAPEAVTLSAFSDFNCTGNWTNRDGALGLEAGSGSGTCQTEFSGVTGSYRITITIQTEFDGKPYYSLSLNNQEISSGQYPLSSSLACDCPKDNWWNVCPDKNEEIDAGVHTVSTGDIIKFYGEEQWECEGHGAYAKWHKISFVPAQ